MQVVTALPLPPRGPSAASLCVPSVLLRHASTSTFRPGCDCASLAVRRSKKEAVTRRSVCNALAVQSTACDAAGGPLLSVSCLRGTLAHRTTQLPQRGGTHLGSLGAARTAQRRCGQLSTFTRHKAGQKRRMPCCRGGSERERNESARAAGPGAYLYASRGAGRAGPQSARRRPPATERMARGSERASKQVRERERESTYQSQRTTGRAGAAEYY